MKPQAGAGRKRETRPVATSGLFTAGERVYYEERKHWAALLFNGCLTLVVAAVSVALANGQADVLAEYRVPLAWVALAVLVVPLAVSMPGPVRGPWVWLGHLAALVWLLGSDSRVARAAALMYLAGVFAWFVVDWLLYSRRYITGRRVIETGGLFGRQVNSILLSSVTGVRFEQPLAGRLFDYGELRLDGSGGGGTIGTLRFMAKPTEVHGLLMRSWTAGPAASAPRKATNGSNGATTIPNGPTTPARPQGPKDRGSTSKGQRTTSSARRAEMS